MPNCKIIDCNIDYHFIHVRQMDIYRLEYITLLIDINTSHNTLLQRPTCAPPFLHNFTQHAHTHARALR